MVEISCPRHGCLIDPKLYTRYELSYDAMLQQQSETEKRGRQ